MTATQRSIEQQWLEVQLVQSGVRAKLVSILLRAGFTSVEELSGTRDALLLALRGVGPQGLAELRRVVPYRGNSLTSRTT
jgi:hypothetical protein